MVCYILHIGSIIVRLEMKAYLYVQYMRIPRRMMDAFPLTSRIEIVRAP